VRNEEWKAEANGSSNASAGAKKLRTAPPSLLIASVHDKTSEDCIFARKTVIPNLIGNPARFIVLLCALDLLREASLSAFAGMTDLRGEK
jgi:hypothetical protein